MTEDTMTPPPTREMPERAVFRDGKMLFVNSAFKPKDGDVFYVRADLPPPPSEASGEVEALCGELEGAAAFIARRSHGGNMPIAIHQAITTLRNQDAEIKRLRETGKTVLALALIKWGNLDPDANLVFDDARAALGSPK